MDKVTFSTVAFNIKQLNGKQCSMLKFNIGASELFNKKKLSYSFTSSTTEIGSLAEPSPFTWRCSVLLTNQTHFKVSIPSHSHLTHLSFTPNRHQSSRTRVSPLFFFPKPLPTNSLSTCDNLLLAQRLTCRKRIVRKTFPSRLKFAGI